MRLFERFALSAAGIILIAGAAAASEVGDIGVFYNSTAPTTCPAGLTDLCAANNSVGVQDGPVFVFQNTSSTAITDGVLTIVGVDFFDVGTIPADSYVVVEPGISNDGQSHGSNNFFTVTGTVFDTSDFFPSLNSTEFEFTGLQGSTQIVSSDICGVIAEPIFTPACTAGEANDGTVSNLNFLGGPGNNDGPCNNCFGPKIVADLETPPVRSTVPEPSSLPLIGVFLAGLGAWTLRRRWRGFRSSDL
ncbi:MAG: PEP-CTERM sorting domain-containing protein [Bryobacteraceae bacterium]